MIMLVVKSRNFDEVDRGGKRCAYNFGREPLSKAATLKTEKKVEGYR
jgi:hypothetical protein